MARMVSWLSPMYPSEKAQLRNLVRISSSILMVLRIYVETLNSLAIALTPFLGAWGCGAVCSITTHGDVWIRWIIQNSNYDITLVMITIFFSLSKVSLGHGTPGLHRIYTFAIVCILIVMGITSDSASNVINIVILDDLTACNINQCIWCILSGKVHPL